MCILSSWWNCINYTMYKNYVIYTDETSAKKRMELCIVYVIPLSRRTITYNSVAGAVALATCNQGFFPRHVSPRSYYTYIFLVTRNLF